MPKPHYRRIEDSDVFDSEESSTIPLCAKCQSRHSSLSVLLLALPWVLFIASTILLAISKNAYGCSDTAFAALDLDQGKKESTLNRTLDYGVLTLWGENRYNTSIYKEKYRFSWISRVLP